MKQYRITINFERLNTLKKLEKSTRWYDTSASNRDDAKKEGLKRFKADEPDRRKIKKVTVVLLKDFSK